MKKKVKDKPMEIVAKTDLSLEELMKKALSTPLPKIARKKKKK